MKKDLQGTIQCSQLSCFDRVLLFRGLRKEVNELLDKETRMWFQRSRARWTIHGDKNSKYFHSRPPKGLGKIKLMGSGMHRVNGVRIQGRQQRRCSAPFCYIFEIEISVDCACAWCVCIYIYMVYVCIYCTSPMRYAIFWDKTKKFWWIFQKNKLLLLLLSSSK